MVEFKKESIFPVCFLLFRRIVDNVENNVNCPLTVETAGGFCYTLYTTALFEWWFLRVFLNFY